MSNLIEANGTATMPPPNGTPKVAPLAETPLERLKRVKLYFNDGTLIADEDYGIIPGASSKKPTLLKPGAQKLCGLFDLAPTIKGTPQRVMKDDLIAYEVTYQVINKKTGVVEGEGAGMCNSRERRYKNQDAWNVANTLLKMAGKRALVDAVLNALGIASIFTQDLEDLDLSNEPKGKSKGAPEAPQFETFDLTGDTQYLRELLAWMKKACPQHPQKRALVDELTKRAGATRGNAGPTTPPASAPAAPENPAPPRSATAVANERILALHHSVESLPGYQEFGQALAGANLDWSTDADLAAFEDAASILAETPIIAEEIGEEWGSYARLVAGGSLRWEA